ncbi:UNVERIFIED_CONTAM: hypothetical protein FKN15_054546 [Acipenser sinensis]
MEAPVRDLTTNDTQPPTLSPAVPPYVKLGLTIAYTVFYSLLFLFVYVQLWLILHYRHKRFSYQTVFLFLCLLWAGLRTVLFSFYFRNFVTANSLSPFVFWLLYCFPVCLQFFTLSLMNLYFVQYYYFFNMGRNSRKKQQRQQQQQQQQPPRQEEPRVELWEVWPGCTWCGHLEHCWLEVPPDWYGRCEGTGHSWRKCPFVGPAVQQPLQPALEEESSVASLPSAVCQVYLVDEECSGCSKFGHTVAICPSQYQGEVLAARMSQNKAP